MKTGLVTNLSSRGLERDATLVQQLLLSIGHDADLLQHDAPCEQDYDLLLFFETITPKLIERSKFAPFLCVNPEFLFDRDIPLIRNQFGRVLCKTRAAHEICSKLFGEKAIFTGFLSEDRHDKDVERIPMFLHVSGASKVKGTDAVLDAWRWNKNGNFIKASLMVVSDWVQESDLPYGVLLQSKITDEHLKFMQNRCIYHLQPSGTEGWSHTLHESLSVNATIVTTDAPSMNEIVSAYKIKPTGKKPFHHADIYEVSALDIHDAVLDMLKLGDRGFHATGAPRKEFLAGNEAFKKTFAGLLNELQPKVPMVKMGGVSRPLRIAFMGNFEAKESTENQILMGLRGEGHHVDCIQENKALLHDIEGGAARSDIFLWVRTPAWLQIPDAWMMEILTDLKARNCPTVSLHLDMFFNIPEREALIGKIPFWKTEFVFTADGGRQEEFRALGVNHFWLKPAASDEYAHPGRPGNEYWDVSFVGARNYHAQHSYRSEMIDFLEATYGSRFKLVEGGIRGHALNDFLASCAINVGDCFGGGKLPYYWSDRMCEVPMRHGFLLSPNIEGMDIPLATYKPMDLDDLKKQIDYWLVHEEERHARRLECAEHVRTRDTWRVRMASILRQVMG